MTSKAKKVQEKLQKQLVESSLSRVWSKTQEHDCALISAEDSYFVVNAKDNPKFVKQIENLGIRYEQDSVCIIQDKGKNAYLIGTNDFADWPGKGKIGKLGKASYGEVVGVYFTRVNGRTFEFVQVESLEKLESYIPQNTLGLLARSIARKQLEKELE